MKALGVAIVVIGLVLIGVSAFVYAGGFPVGADVPHSQVVLWMLRNIRDRTIVVRSGDIHPPADLQGKSHPDWDLTAFVMRLPQLAPQRYRQITAQAPTNQSATPTAPASAAAHTVAIKALAYTPAILTVSRGDTVVWKNEDPIPHTVTADKHAFDSGSIAPGHSWRYVARRSGTFTYHCTFHPNMHGTLRVK